MWVAFACQVRRKEQPARSGWNGCGLFAEFFKGRVWRNFVVQPAQTTCCTEHHAHVKPHSRRGVAKRMQPTMRFRVIAVCGGESHTRCADGQAGCAAMCNAVANAASRLIARTSDDRRSG